MRCGDIKRKWSEDAKRLAWKTADIPSDELVLLGYSYAEF